jgi:phenylalanine-4-hydroxylase
MTDQLPVRDIFLLWLLAFTNGFWFLTTRKLRRDMKAELEEWKAMCEVNHEKWKKLCDEQFNLLKKTMPELEKPRDGTK